MQKDFHFNCIAVLARAAGFKVEQALTLAYASQYVDDSVESERIKVGGMYFDPVRTAHYGLRAFDWSVQKNIYISFHFIPPHPLKTPQDPLRSEPNSEFAQMIWKEALKEKEGTQRLCRLGIALHTIADSWAHSRFSGREDDENKVANIRVSENGGWINPKLPNFYLDFLPKIGHAKAGHYPDQPWQKWMYLGYRPRRKIHRNNTDEFMHAAEHIHGLLKRVRKTKPDPVKRWSSISDKIHDLFTIVDEKVDRRCHWWREEFRDFIPKKRFVYDRLQWRREALGNRNIQFEDMSRRQMARLSFGMTRGFWDSNWVCFHRAALRQRHFVLENFL